MNRQHFCDLDAVVLRQEIGAGTVSPVDLLESCIDRINVVNQAVNAVVTTCFESARREAKIAEKAVDNGESLPPLHGLPVLVKDLSDTKGMLTTYGSQCYKDHVPDKDSAIVERLRRSGAIVIGKTNTPEFGAGANTTNLVFGATCNPFQPALTSGGSSGGSAVALSCGMAPLSTGSDLGGSLRIPASFCSVLGMRPSPGIVPSNTHVLGFSPLWTDGPLARSVADINLFLQGITGYEKNDPLSRNLEEIRGNRESGWVDLKSLKAGFTTDLGMAPVDQDIAKVFSQRKRVIQSCFADSEECGVDLSEAAEIFRVLRTESLYAAYADLVNRESALIGDNVRGNIQEAESYSLADIARAGAKHTRLFRQFQQVFNDVDILICPTTAVTPFPVSESYPEKINGQSLDGYYSWYAITWALSLTGCPVISLPCGVDHKGMPFGIQIVANKNQDRFLLAVASALESALAQQNIGRVQPDLDMLTSL